MNICKGCWHVEPASEVTCSDCGRLGCEMCNFPDPRDRSKMLCWRCGGDVEVDLERARRLHIYPSGDREADAVHERSLRDF